MASASATALGFHSSGAETIRWYLCQRGCPSPGSTPPSSVGMRMSLTILSQLIGKPRPRPREHRYDPAPRSSFRSSYSCRPHAREDLASFGQLDLTHSRGYPPSRAGIEPTDGRRPGTLRLLRLPSTLRFCHFAPSRASDGAGGARPHAGLPLTVGGSSHGRPSSHPHRRHLWPSRTRPANVMLAARKPRRRVAGQATAGRSRHRRGR